MAPAEQRDRADREHAGGDEHRRQPLQLAGVVVEHGQRRRHAAGDGERRDQRGALSPPLSTWPTPAPTSAAANGASWET